MEKETIFIMRKKRFTKVHGKMGRRMALENS